MRKLIRSFRMKKSTLTKQTQWKTLLTAIVFSFSTIFSFAQTCNNVTDGGQIIGEQIGCPNPTFDPLPIRNVSFPSGGGTAELEYMWMYSINPPNGDFSTWVPIPNTNNAEYDPGPLTVTTYFARCSRRKGCTDFKESSTVAIYVSCCGKQDGGKISGTQTIGCGNSFDPSPINSITGPSGGSGGWTYFWYKSTVNSQFSNTNTDWTLINGANSESYDPPSVSQNTYFIRLAKANNCVDNVFSNVVSVILKPQVQATVVATAADCSGGNNGAISTTVTGGTAPYSYAWNYGAIGNVQNPTGLAAATYSVTITDAFGCNTVASAVVDQANKVNIIPKATNIKCYGTNDGAIDIIVSGGRLPYTFQWNTGGYTSGTINNLAIGTYAVTVTDANGCVRTTTATITQPSNIVLNTSASGVNCGGSNNGSVFLTVSGGTPPYTYLWSNNVNTQNISNVAAGTYSVTVTDANGCTKSTTTTVDAPNELVLTLNSQNKNCSTDTQPTIATASVQGGSAPYTYLWSNGAKDAVLTNIAAGTYSLTVTDNNGCTKTGSVNIAAPSDLNIAVSGTNILCNGNSKGTAIANVSNGKLPYTIRWSNGATGQYIENLSQGIYTVTITDANGCSATGVTNITAPPTLDLTTSTATTLPCSEQISVTATGSGGVAPYSYKWSNGATSNSVSLPTGDYNVTVTDANACTVSKSITLQTNANLVIDVSKTDINCFGSGNGSATVIANGGKYPFIYAWSNGKNTQYIDNLTAGIYSVTVSDATGCTKTSSITIVENPNLVLNITSTNGKCSSEKGSATATIAGGTAPYTFKWSNGASSATISNLEGGTYTLTVTDGKGCQKASSVTIVVPAAMNVNVSKTDITCGAVNNGSASLVVDGGQYPYTYAWSNGKNTQYIDGLSAGNYTVTVTDVNGCSVAKNVTILEGPVVNLSISKTDINCFGNNNGSATATITGGTYPYTYAWNNGKKTQYIEGLTAGIYTLTISDATGCTKTSSITIVENPNLVLNITSTNGKCSSEKGSATATIAGGTAPYTFKWSNGASSATISNLEGGTYTLTVTDGKGCQKASSVTIVVPAAMNVNVSKTDITCGAVNNGSASLVVDGGQYPYTYAWSNGKNTQYIDGLSAGNYTVTVTDVNGCSVAKNVTILEGPVVNLSISKTDINCFGNNNGSATATITGGTYPYTYAWSNGKNTQYIEGLTAGIYTLTISDATGCTKTSSITIVENPNLVLNIASTNGKCSSEKGSATATIAGGTAPYTFKWSNGASSATISNLEGGTYTLTVTDGKGCQKASSVTIVVPAAMNVNVSKTDITCGAVNNGSASLVVDGGQYPYTYAWSNGKNTQYIDGLSSGNYTVTVTDVNGCSVAKNVTILEGPVVNLSISKTDINCFGNNNGSATATITGGTYPYTYAWNNGKNTQYIEGLTAGIYTLTISDATGCTKTSSITIVENPNLVLNITSTNGKCSSEKGSATATIAGGTAPYTFKWSNGASSATISNLEGGIYTLTVTDGKGCQKASSVTIVVPAAMNVNVSKTDITCGAVNNGSASLVVDGGQYPYTYAWSNGKNTQYIDGLSAGNYTVTVTDVNGCSVAKNVTILEGPVVNLSISKTDINCFGNNNGSATATITGGTYPYTYAWNNGKKTQYIEGLTAGIYTLTISDATGCTKTSSITIVENPNLVLNITSTNGKCSSEKGSATATIAGGTAPYTFKWSNGASSATISNLEGGIYTLTVTDGKGCQKASSVTIVVPAAMNVNVSKTDITCGAVNNGSASLVVDGGQYPYTYAWSNGKNTQYIDGLSSGNYTVTVTDVNGCSVAKNVTILEGPVVNLSISKTDINCFGNNNGSATATITGGTYPYTYAWNNGKNTQYIEGLTAGIYTLTISDATGCTKTSSITIVENPNLVLNITSTNGKCSSEKGSATATIAGGTAPYTFKWSNGASSATISNLEGGIYTLTVTDGKGCQKASSVTIVVPAAMNVNVSKTDITCGAVNNGSASLVVDGGQYPYTYAWSNGKNTQYIDGLSAGNYTVTVTDVNGCSVAKNVTILEGPVVNLSISKTDINCFGNNNGSATATITGGTYPYTYAWNNGKNTQYIEGLTAGIYTLTISDATGCTKTSSITIVENPNLVLNITSTNGKCSSEKGSATATIAGGTAPYTFKWSNGASSATISNLEGGTYTLTVTDGKGCQKASSVTIVVPAAMNVNVSKTDITCGAVNNGSASLVVDGGQYPYTYAWSNGKNTQYIDGLSAGNYTVTVTDVNGCSVAKNVTILEGPVVNLSISKTDINCFGNNNGSATATITGGTYPYTYAWNNGKKTQYIEGLTAGIYTLTISDATGCTKTSSITIVENPNLVLNITSTNGKCSSEKGSATATIAGGTAPYTFKWSNGASSATISNLEGGTYTLTVTDGKGCQKASSVTIVVPAAMNVNVSKTDITCGAVNNGSASLVVDGGQYPYTYAWSNGKNTQYIDGLSAGTYTVTVTDVNGCTKTGAITIVGAQNLVLTASSTNVRCKNANDGSATVSVAGGIAPYTYLWSNNSTTQSISNLTTGIYTVVVTDSKGCKSSASVLVFEPSLLEMTFSVVNVKCYGDNSGQATVSITGNTAPYTYKWSNNSPTQTITGVGVGTYSVTVTDKNGCTQTGSVDINTVPNLVVNLNTTNITGCNGGSLGSATATVTGGAGNYTYKWSNGATSAAIYGLSAGTYTLTVTDGNGCLKVTNTTINASGVSNIVLDFQKTNIYCNGSSGSANVVASSGILPYTYAWSNGQNAASINNLSAGTYTVTVTDAKGCSKVGFITVEAISTPIVVNINSDNNNCFGSATATATANVVGGTLPYTYAWSNGRTTQSINNLANGTYSVTVTDGKGCTSTASATITSPNQLKGSINASNVSCNSINDGAAAVSITGGTTPYTNHWSTGEFTPNISRLGAGTYSVTVSDINGCTATATTTISQNQGVDGNISKQDIYCNGGTGSATVNITSGVPNYTYVWSNGNTTQSVNNLTAGTYTVTITDANACKKSLSTTIAQSSSSLLVTTTASNIDACSSANTGAISTTVSDGTAPYTYAWSNGATTQNLSSVAAGTYTVTVTDKNGCTRLSSATITKANSTLAVNMVSTNVKCTSNGTATLTASGGNAPYTYTWSNGSSNASISNLNAGTYSVTVVDAKGCSAIGSVTIINETTNIVINLVANNIKCTAQGSITANVSSGTAPYTYAWSNGATVQNLSGLAVGTYTVTITDAKGCKNTATTSITDQSSTIVVNITTQDAKCNAGGSATATVSGGLAPYTYKWSNNATNQSINNATSGTYSLTVTDANGCSKIQSATINAIQNTIVLTTNTTNVACNGASNGSATLNVSGGATPYSYAWSNGNTSNTISNIKAGTYTITVTDANTCSKTTSVVITEPTALGATITATPITLCSGANNASASVNVSGGKAPYTYLWSNNATTQTISNLASGTYNVTVTDANNCKTTAIVTISASKPISCVASIVKPISASGVNDGTLTVNSTGGIAPYSYLWSNGATTQTIANLSAGTYKVTITDANGCTCVTTDIILSNPIRIVNIGDYVFEDRNRNGIQDDASEPGVAGVTVKLINVGADGLAGTADDILIATQVTDINGKYLFTDVQEGKYVVQFVKPTTESFTTANQGADRNKDSNVTNPSTGMTDVFMVTRNQADDLSIDAGLYEACDNTTNGGAIGNNQKICSGTFPSIINSLADATGGSGTLQYLWLYSNYSASYKPGDPRWLPIPNSNSASYQPGRLTQTTYFIRCARRASCSTYPAESNVLTIEVVTPPIASISSSSNSYCTNASYGFDATDVGAGATYYWTFGDGATTTAATTRSVAGVTWTSAGTKNITLTVTNNGCVSTSTISINVASCFVNTITNLTARATATGQVALEWQTGSPTDITNIFEIEHAPNTDNFNSLATLEARNIFSPTSLSYNYMHETPKVGINYYRVKHFGFDGKLVTSRIASATILPQNGDDVLIYPNPAISYVNVELLHLKPKLDTHIAIVDVLGHLLDVITVPAGVSQKQIDISKYPAGFIFFNIDSNGYTKTTYKIFKQE